MSNYMAEAFAPIEAHYKAEVMSATWGHLAAQEGKKHKGYMVFTLTDHGCYEVIRSHFRGLADSPWFFAHANDFVSKRARARGAIYRFDGTYEFISHEGGDYKFTGTVTKLNV
jgi:hypothetical protein